MPIVICGKKVSVCDYKNIKQEYNSVKARINENKTNINAEFEKNLTNFNPYEVIRSVDNNSANQSKCKDIYDKLCYYNCLCKKCQNIRKKIQPFA
uniref:Uncharacterized protein n=1 Tax=viral metagenome TaxID=1070528 RepID=A0A6C0JDY7_9ZZZZ